MSLLAAKDRFAASPALAAPNGKWTARLQQSPLLAGLAVGTSWIEYRHTLDWMSSPTTLD